jgi:hypothetical protein
MKRYAALAMGLCLVVTTLSLNAIAADESSPRKESGTQQNVQPKPVRKHSHMEDKGLPSPDRTSAGKAGKADRQQSGTDKSRHLHPRDGK